MSFLMSKRTTDQKIRRFNSGKAQAFGCKRQVTLLDWFAY